ncbi:hypothetical protein [Mucilaginibacter sp.]
MRAILTADIVNSSMLTTAFDNLIVDLKQFFDGEKTDFYNGDSFRVLVTQPETALLKCIKSRLLAIKYAEKHTIDIRVSINIGHLRSDDIDLRSSMDELLVASGRSFAKLQGTSRRLYINSGNAEKDFTYEIIAEYADSLLAQITAKQAKVIYQLLSGKSQVETAAFLGLSTATVSKQVKAGRYEEIRSVLNKFETLTNQLQNGN